MPGARNVCCPRAEVGGRVIDLFLGDRSGRQVDGPLPQVSRVVPGAADIAHPALHGIGLFADVDGDAVAFLPGIERVDHEAGVDLVPADVGVASVARHDPKSGTALGAPGKAGIGAVE